MLVKPTEKSNITKEIKNNNNIKCQQTCMPTYIRYIAVMKKYISL